MMLLSFFNIPCIPALHYNAVLLVDTTGYFPCTNTVLSDQGVIQRQASTLAALDGTGSTVN